MIKYFSIFILLLLSSCSIPSFDHNEYLLVVQIKQQAINGDKYCNIDTHGAFDRYGLDIEYKSQLWSLYATEEYSQKMANDLHDMSLGFIVDSKKNISKIFCHEKFKNIDDATTIIIKALHKKG